MMRSISSDRDPPYLLLYLAGLTGTANRLELMLVIPVAWQT